MTKFSYSIIYLSWVTAISSPAFSAPVVVQKGSTAQYIYIPGSSVAEPSGGNNSNSATSAKQFCKVFVTADTTYNAKPASMLEDSYKIGAILIGGGSGGNVMWVDSDPEGNRPPVYHYASAGGGGSTAVLLNGALVAAAAGADAPTGVSASGANGERVTAPEFTFSKNPPSVIQVVIGAGGASGTPEPGYQNWSIGGLYAGWGGRGYFGGGAGAKMQSATNLGPSFYWASPARGGSRSMGGVGAVPMQGTNQFTGGPGSYMNGGAGSSGRAASPSYGALKYGHFAYGGWLSTGYEFIEPRAYGGSNYTTGVPVNNNTGNFAVRVTGGVTGSQGPDENNLGSFGKGGIVQGNVSTTGTGGIVMLYYSAPLCNVL